MTKQECARSRVTEVRNGWTLISSSESCVEWVSVPVGWAKPALYSAKTDLEQQIAADKGRQLSQMFGEIPSGFSSIQAKLAAAIAISGDMDALVQKNACNGPGLARFEENLRRFALNRQPISFDGKKPGGAVTHGNHDYRRLVNDLVEADAPRWGIFATFVYGSIGSVTVQEKDSLGRPLSVVAPYAWESMLGVQRGMVTLKFVESLPNCFSYSKTPAVCHAADRKIVADYAAGKYAQ